MNPFRYAKSVYSDDYLRQQVTWDFALLLLSLLAVFLGLVLIRRAFGVPRRSTTGAIAPSGLVTIERHEIGGRFWHWSLFGMLLALWISGAAFYAPGRIAGPVPLLGLSWLFVHLAFGFLFIVGTFVHSVHAFVSHLDPRTVWFDRNDGREMVAGMRYFLGVTQELPKLGKFSVWSKLFHTALVLPAVVMIVTGISLGLDTLGWATIDQNWQRQQRLLHDLGSYGFLVLLAAHVFWQVLKARRAQLRSIFTGVIPAETFNANHDWDRWKPHTASKSANAETVKHG